MGKIIAKLKSIKHIEVILAVLAVGVMLVIYFTTFAGGKEEKTQTTDGKADYCAAMQVELRRQSRRSGAPARPRC